MPRRARAFCAVSISTKRIRFHRSCARANSPTGRSSSSRFRSWRMNVPLLDLKAQYLAIKSDIDRGIAEVLESQHFILGPKVEACERSIAQYSRCTHGV